MAYVNCHSQFGPVDCATLANRPGQFYPGGSGYGQAFCYSKGGYLVNCARGTGDCDCFVPSGPAPSAAPAPRVASTPYVAPGVTGSSPLPVRQTAQPVQTIAAPESAPIIQQVKAQAIQAPASTKTNPLAILAIAGIALLILTKGIKNVHGN